MKWTATSTRMSVPGGSARRKAALPPEVGTRVEGWAEVRRSFLELEHIDEPIAKIQALDQALAEVWLGVVRELRARRPGRDRWAVMTMIDGYRAAMRDIQEMAHGTAERAKLNTDEWQMAMDFSVATICAESYAIRLSGRFVPGADDVAGKRSQDRALRDLDEAYEKFAASVHKLAPSYVPRLQGLEAAE